jgi:hypothetical protein
MLFAVTANLIQDRLPNKKLAAIGQQAIGVQHAAEQA